MISHIKRLRKCVVSYNISLTFYQPRNLKMIKFTCKVSLTYFSNQKKNSLTYVKLLRNLYIIFNHKHISPHHDIHRYMHTHKYAYIYN